MILGIDEVGRGPWAGPLVVGAVVLGGKTIEGLTDSKKLSKKRREELDSLIREQASGFGLGWVSPEEIDTIGLSEALKRATIRAVSEVKASYNEIIIDGTVNFLHETGKGKYVTTMKKADLLVPSVSAASIIAKVARDAYMSNQDAYYPEYGFASHVGYGTAAHIAAIEKFGVTPLHRLSIEPLKKYAETPREHHRMETVRGSKTSKQKGDNAEDEVASYLRKQGHTILDRNWKTKYCEIDIVSQCKDTIYFTEVKHRKTDTQGGGIAAITSKKLRQMTFAAKYYELINHVDTHNLQLAVATTHGSDFIVEQWMPVL